MDTDKEKRRDARLRRSMLTSLKLCQASSPRGGQSGQSLVDSANSTVADDQQIESDSHGIALIRELASAGYVTISYGTMRRGQAMSLRHIDLVTITEKGLRLWAEEIGPDLLVEDDRIEI